MTLVLDASVVVEYIVSTPAGRALAPLLLENSGDLHVPHIAIVETTSVMRGLVLGGRISAERAAIALSALRDLPARRWPADHLLTRIWSLRTNLTAYDATYVALAEALDATLLTGDARLARGLAGVSDCRVIVTDI